MEKRTDVLARMAIAYELGTSLDGTVLTVTFEHEHGETVIGILAEALPRFINSLREADEQFGVRRQRLRN